ncbi:MAG: glycosyltransferase [Bacteroidota bacterium]|nr:glycosyltransferase [Bacteroidota bacterium]
MNTPGKKINLCIIHPNFKCGGSERFISIMCNNINTDAFNVEFYILDGSNPFYQISNPNVKVTFLNIKNVRNSLFTILKIIKKSKPDILFTASNHLNLFLSIFKFLFPQNLKWVARESSIISINSQSSGYGKVYHYLLKKFYKNIDHIICQSEYMQNDLVKNYKIKKKKTTIIYNPVEDIPNIGISSIPIQKNKYKFFTVGRLSSEKGIDRLLESVALLEIDFGLHIIGDGKEKNNLQQLANKLHVQNKVFFEGQKSNPYENMYDADLFLLGSHYEGFPNVVLEAGMLGIPVVAFNSPGGIAEIIEDGMNGFLAENNNTRAFSDIIIKAIKYNFNKESIINITKEKFSAPKIIHQLEDYLIKICKSNLAP